jgi:hypothetical protein
VHLFLAEVDPAAVSELGGDPERAVDAAGVLVNLGDLAGKPVAVGGACGSIASICRDLLQYGREDSNLQGRKATGS